MASRIQFGVALRVFEVLRPFLPLLSLLRADRHRIERFLNAEYPPVSEGPIQGIRGVSPDDLIAMRMESAQLRFRVMAADVTGTGQGEATTVLDQTGPVRDSGPVIQELSFENFEGGRYRLEVDLVDLLRFHPCLDCEAVRGRTANVSMHCQVVSSVEFQCIPRRKVNVAFVRDTI